MIALKYPLTGGPFGSPVFLSTSEIVPRFSCIASPHQRTNGRVFFRTGQFTPPDSSRRTIRFLAIPPSGRSFLDLRNTVRPFIHPAPPGTTSCHLPVQPRGTTSGRLPIRPLSRPFSPVRHPTPGTPSAHSPPHSRNPVRPRTHGSQRIRLHRNPICPPAPAIRTLPADPTATPLIHPSPPLRKPQKKRSRNRIGFRDHPIDNGRQSMLCNRIISTTGSGRTPHPNGSAASRSDRPKGSRRGSSTFRRSTRHWSS